MDRKQTLKSRHVLLLSNGSEFKMKKVRCLPFVVIGYSTGGFVNIMFTVPFFGNDFLEAQNGAN